MFVEIQDKSFATWKESQEVAYLLMSRLRAQLEYLMKHRRGGITDWDKKFLRKMFQETVGLLG